jgi:hypothetical protein
MRFEILCTKGTSTLPEWVAVDAWNYDEAVRTVTYHDYTPLWPPASRQYNLYPLPGELQELALNGGSGSNGGQVMNPISTD